MFFILYHQHGGSGLSGISYDNVMKMDINEIQWWGKRLNREREKEAKALKKARSG